MAQPPIEKIGLYASADDVANEKVVN